MSSVGVGGGGGCSRSESLKSLSSWGSVASFKTLIRTLSSSSNFNSSVAAAKSSSKAQRKSSSSSVNNSNHIMDAAVATAMPSCGSMNSVTSWGSVASFKRLFGNFSSSSNNPDKNMKSKGRRDTARSNNNNTMNSKFNSVMNNNNSEIEATKSNYQSSHSQHDCDDFAGGNIFPTSSCSSSFNTNGSLSHHSQLFQRHGSSHNKKNLNNNNSNKNETISSSSGSGNNISQKMKLRLKRELKRATTTNSKFVEHTKEYPTSPTMNNAAACI